MSIRPAVAWLAAHELAAPFAIGVLSRVFSVAQLLLVTVHAPTRFPLLTDDRSPFVGWDGQWFLSIAEKGYHAQPLQQGPLGGRLDIAFFPAWPVLIRVATFGVLPPAATATILASILFCLAAPLIYLALEPAFGRHAAAGAVALIAFSPAAFSFSMAYSEPLFLLLIGAYFAARRRPAIRPAAAALAMLTRFTGVALVPSALVEAIRTRQRWAVISLAAILATLVAWWAYGWWLTGDPSSLLVGTEWVRFSGIAGINRALGRFDAQVAARLGFVAVVAFASLVSLRRSPELGAYAVTAVAMAVIGGTVASMPRYVAVALPAFAVISSRLGRVGTLVAAVAFAAAQVWFAWLAFIPVVTATP